MTLPALGAYAVTLLLFLVIDGVWLGVLAGGLYRSQLGTLMAERFNLLAAGAFYLIFALGLTVFVVWPTATSSPEASGFPTRALLLGALLGLTAYGTYDLTNLAVLKGWPVPITLVDLAWGTTLSAVVATLAVLVTRRFL